VQTGFRVVLLLLLAAAGAVLVASRPGLKAEYFALGAPWEGRPFNTAVGEPRLESASQVGEALMTKVVFSIRWSGWWDVAQEGEHHFSLAADDGGYLRIDDELIVDTGGVFGERLEAGRKALEPGFHAVEIGLYQTLGESRLAVDWVAPGSTHESAAPLPRVDLYSGRPLVLRKILRRTLAAWQRPYRQFLGVILLLAAVLLLRGFAARFEGPAAGLRTRLGVLDGRRFRAGLLLGLFVLAFFAIFPFTGTVFGGDDSAYLNAASFNVKYWFYNRYAHVYLLKLFTAFSGGDPLVGVRVWWSFVFASTVAALAVAVASVGPGLQLRTFAVTLFVLFAQGLFGFIGAGFADVSTMMFITVAVATYMHGLGGHRERPPPRHEWHALAIGALTMGAYRSKEVGAVLLLLPILFLIESGRLDLRGFARKMAYWMAGAFGVLLALVLLDGWILGDALFTLPSRHVRSLPDTTGLPVQLGPRKVASSSWLQIIWQPRKYEANLALRNLWLGVCAAAVVAGLRKRRLELRLLHLMPIAYLLALVALYFRMHVRLSFSGRMLLPILPVACLMTGLLLHYAGLDEVPWRRMLQPRVLIPAAVAAAVVFFVAVPYQLGTLEAASFLPVAFLRRYGWQPDHFLVGVVLPAVVLIAVSGVALVASRRRVRVTALLVAYLMFFSVGFELTRAGLAKRWAVQKGELLLYPWKTFRSELDAAPSRVVALSRDLGSYYRMSGTARGGLGHLALGRRDFSVVSAGRLPATLDVAIASRYAYDEWRLHTPALARALEATASFDPDGFLVLVRPKEAAEQAARLRQQRIADGLPPEPRLKSLKQRLDDSRSSRDAEAREELLQAILDSLQGPGRGRSIGLRHLQGEQLRAVALSPDGWTQGDRAAGLIVENGDESPLVQELTLAVHADSPDYPIRVFVDDGEQVETVRFDRRGSRKIELRPVPARSRRLFIVWSEKAWAPARNEQRKLGVKILGPVKR
jgi:hypothetical protein